MRRGPTLYVAVLFLFLGDIAVAPGNDKSAPKDLGDIPPPGGAPLRVSERGREISASYLKKASKRLEAAPAEDLDKWIAELERIMGRKLEGDLARQACRTYFVTQLSVAFDELEWNAKAAEKLFRRARTLPPAEAKAWTEAFESLLKKEIGQTATTNSAGGPAYAVPLVLVPADALYEGEKYSAERARKYRARLKQLTAEDVSLWKDQVDRFGGTDLDAALNLVLLDDFFGKEHFQRDAFQAAIEARRK